MLESANSPGVSDMPRAASLKARADLSPRFCNRLIADIRRLYALSPQDCYSAWLFVDERLLMRGAHGRRRPLKAALRKR